MSRYHGDRWRTIRQDRQWRQTVQDVICLSREPACGGSGDNRPPPPRQRLLTGVIAAYTLSEDSHA